MKSTHNCKYDLNMGAWNLEISAVLSYFVNSVRKQTSEKIRTTALDRPTLAPF